MNKNLQMPDDTSILCYSAHSLYAVGMVATMQNPK